MINYLSLSHLTPYQQMEGKCLYSLPGEENPLHTSSNIGHDFHLQQLCILGLFCSVPYLVDRMKYPCDAPVCCVHARPQYLLKLAFSHLPCYIVTGNVTPNKHNVNKL